jgi:hypothetical protein
MQGLIMVALVCGSALLPDQCSRETALDVIVSPARTLMDCALGGARPRPRERASLRKAPRI